MSKFSDMAVSIPSPLEKLNFKNLTQEVWMKRDDLIHPIISGNKYRKLKYHLERFLESGKKEVVTLGGAFSNHLSATAFTCNKLGIPSTAFIKYHKIDSGNPTMVFCTQHKMTLKPVGHSCDEEVLKYSLSNDQYFIPEGGSGYYGEHGMKEMVDEVLQEITPNYWLVSIGKGATIRGMLRELPPSQKIIGVSSFSRSEMLRVLGLEESDLPANLILIEAGFLGRFGHMKEPLVDFVRDFYENHNIILDPIYTSKMMYVLGDLLSSAVIPASSKVVAIHTGGLQGWEGMRYRNPKRSFPPFKK